MQIAFIIPTKGRYQELKRLLDSIEKQTLKPDLVIILDSNTRYAKDKLGNHTVSLQYIHTGPNSLTEARNIGIKYVPEDFKLVGFLDDDVILHENALEIMLNFWQRASGDTGGAAFNIINNRKPRRFWVLKNIFLMGDSRPGNILPSGYQTMLDKIEEDTYTKWLPGGGTVWRKVIFNDFKFDENIRGYGFAEDLDFSYRIGKKYKLISIAGAKLIHMPHPVHGSDNIKFGASEIINRKYFINKHREFSKTLFFWACLGQLLENVVFGILSFKSCFLLRARGNLLGITKIIFNAKEHNVEAAYKKDI